MTERVTKQEFLAKAIQVVQERQKAHGHVGRTFSQIADLWGAFLEQELSASQVALMMVLLKIARSQEGEYNEDDYIDLLGYGSIAAELDAKDAAKSVKEILEELS